MAKKFYSSLLLTVLPALIGLLSLVSCSKAFPDSSLISLLLLNEETTPTTTTPDAPTVSSVTPADGTTGISVLGTTIVVTFSEEMDPATVTALTVSGACSQTIQLSSDNFSTCAGGTLTTTDNISFSFTPSVNSPTAGLNARILITTAATSIQEVALESQWISASGFTLYTPANVAGLELWLHADSFTSLSDTNTISVWTDSSGRGNNAFQSTATDRPLYRNTGGPNNMPWVQFPGATEHFDLSEFMAFTDPTLIIVGFATTGTAQQFYSDYGGAALSRYTLGVDATNTLLPEIVETVADGGSDIYNGATIAGTVSNTTATPSIMVMTKSGTDSNFFVDGTQINGPTTSSNAGFNNTTQFDGTTGVDNPSIGKRSLNVLTDYLNGGIAEIIMYNTTITATERARVECYLSRKYSIAGPTC